LRSDGIVVSIGAVPGNRKIHRHLSEFLAAILIRRLYRKIACEAYASIRVEVQRLFTI
jgi:hypothetical protein